MKSIQLILLTLTIGVTNLLNAQCKKDTVYFYDIDVNTKTKTAFERDIYQYNSSDLVSEILNQKPGSATSQWNNESKTIYTYDANKNKTQVLSQLWNTDNSIWVNQSKINNSYDSKNNLIQEIIAGWLTSNSSWVNSQKRELTINNKNKVTEEIIQLWNLDNPGWDNYLKSAFTYDGELNLIEIISMSWDNNKSQWNNIFNSNFKYNSENKITEEISQTWDIDNSEWRDEKKVIYTYDGKYLSEMYTYFITSDGKNWLDFKKESYEYSNADVIAVNRFANWNETNKDFDNLYREEVICQKNASSIKSIQTNPITIFPNPINNGFILIQSLYNTNYTLIDYTGKVQLQGLLIEGFNKIDITQFTTGVYFVKINNQSHKLIIQ